MIRFASLLLILVAASSIASAEGEQERVVVAWLSLVDAGQFSQAWIETDPRLQKEMDRVRWITGLKRSKQDAGDTISRKFLRFVAKPDYRPDIEGEIYFAMFETEYSKKGRMFDIVFVVQHAGELRVYGFNRGYPMSAYPISNLSTKN